MNRARSMLVSGLVAHWMRISMDLLLITMGMTLTWGNNSLIVNWKRRQLYVHCVFNSHDDTPYCWVFYPHQKSVTGAAAASRAGGWLRVNFYCQCAPQPPDQVLMNEWVASFSDPPDKTLSLSSDWQRRELNSIKSSWPGRHVNRAVHTCLGSLADHVRAPFRYDQQRIQLRSSHWNQEQEGEEVIWICR